MQGELPNGSDNDGIRAYYDLGVPVQRPAGIAGGIANGEVGSIGGGVANSRRRGGVAGGLADGGVNSLGGDIGQPDGLDFSAEFPPDESQFAGSGDFDSSDATPTTGGIGGDVANSGAAAGSAGAFPPDLSETGNFQPATGAVMFNGRTSAGGRQLDRNQGGIDRLNARFGDDF